MKICTALSLPQNKTNNSLPQNKSQTVISFVGGGGKTSSILALANELADIGANVLITTTTAMYPPENISSTNISVLGDHISVEGKLKGISTDEVDKLAKEGCYDYILVEADGSKRKAIKAPADHEPVVPNSTDIMVGVIGMSVYQKKINEDFVHRPEILMRLTNTRMESPIDENVFLQLVKSPSGLFKNCPLHAQKVLLLNQVLDKEMQEIAYNIGINILNNCEQLDKILLGAVLERDPIKERLQR